MASAKTTLALFTAFGLLVSAPLTAGLSGTPREKIPYRPQWVSVLKKGRLFKYKRRETASPRIYGDKIFVGSDNGFFYALEKRNGRKKWRFRAEGPVGSTPAFWAGDGGERVFFGDDKGTLYSLFAKDGKEIWRTPLKSEILAEPVVSGDRLFVVTLEGRVVCLDVQEGKILWERGRQSPSLTMTILGNSPPVVDPQGGRIFAGFSDGVLWSLSAVDGSLLWEKSLGRPGLGFEDVDGAPWVDGDRICVATFDPSGGGLFALSKKNGQILWNREIGSGVPIVGEGESLIVSGSNGHLYALNKKDGQKIWEVKVGEGALTRPVLYKDLVVVGLSGSTINFVDRENGHLIARRFARKGIYSEPLVEGDRIYYLSNGGRLYSLKFVR